MKPKTKLEMNSLAAAALLGLEEQLKRVDALRAAIRRAFDPQPNVAAELATTASTTKTFSSLAPPVKNKRKGKMSAAGRKAVSEAQKKRWAKWHKKNNK